MEKEQEAESMVIKEGCLQRIVIVLGLCLQQHQLALWHVSADAVSDMQTPSPIKIQIPPCSHFPTDWSHLGWPLPGNTTGNVLRLQY